MLFQKVVELKKDEFLFQSGDLGTYFYFTMEGKFELLVKQEDTGQFKFSKTVEESSFFGQKKQYTETRVEYARVVSDKCTVLQFDTKKYFDIVSKT